MSILVTGGLGYIGSHITLQLLNLNYKVIVLDNLLNCSIKKLEIIKSNIQAKERSKNLLFERVDMLDYPCLDNIFVKYEIIGVIHLAGLKSVNESISNPELYYNNNIVSTLNLIKCMKKYQVYNMIFSSSATVYGISGKCPCKETDVVGLGITNPYGKTKYLQEEILVDLHKSDSRFKIIILRYFNPIGHLNIDFKEEPNGIPNNLFPYIVKVHKGELEKLTIFGSNYNTEDGTCVRDFIHVQDLADSHIACLAHLETCKEYFSIYNVGRGVGISVLELINTYEKINGVKINYVIGDRRNGDIEKVYADVQLIKDEIGWECKYSLESMVKI